ncbi:MAG: AraC family transcriptional regulator ligand-binding domain-containing protein [Sandaracinaceae bacterium]|nr:AraC family transcriptional regulator ligand-binding domain-containing protein [Sandaracinaceae bacterium]
MPQGTPWQHVPFEHLCDLVEAGLELTGDAHLGLRLRLELDPRAGGILILLLLSCPDVRSAVKRMVRYQHVLYDAHRIEPEDHERRLVVVMPGPERPALAQLRAWMLADIVDGVRTMTGQALRPEAITIEGPAPADVAPLTRALDAPIAFDAPRTTITFDEAALRTKLRHANSMFLDALEHEARQLAAALPRRRSWVERARGALEDELPREPTLESAAARLRVSPRTLQRRLAAEGTHVAELLSGIRRERAARLLREGRDIAEVAYLLGYASSASFHRAFRAWFGTTPAAWRDEG